MGEKDCRAGRWGLWGEVSGGGQELGRRRDGNGGFYRKESWAMRGVGRVLGDGRGGGEGKVTEGDWGMGGLMASPLTHTRKIPGLVWVVLSSPSPTPTPPDPAPKQEHFCVTSVSGNHDNIQRHG